MVKEDGSGFIVRMTFSGVSRIGQEWLDFTAETKTRRTILYDTLAEQDTRPISMLRHVSKEEMDEFISTREEILKGDVKARIESSPEES